MSLETSLELNNQLLAQHNALLERLIRTMASGIVMHPDTISRVQECRDTATETENMSAAMTLDDLEFSDVIALAGFYPVAPLSQKTCCNVLLPTVMLKAINELFRLMLSTAHCRASNEPWRCLNLLSSTCPVTSLSSGRPANHRRATCFCRAAT